MRSTILLCYYIIMVALISACSFNTSKDRCKSNMGERSKYYYDHKKMYEIPQIRNSPTKKIIDKFTIGKYDTIIRLYDDASPFHNGLSKVRLHNNYGTRYANYGYIDKQGNEVIKPIYDDIHILNQEGLVVVYKDAKASVLNTNLKGEVVIDSLSYEAIADTKQLNKKSRKILRNYLDIKNESIKRLSSHEEIDFSEGLAAIEVNDVWGYMDKQNKLVIKPQFEKAHRFSEGLAEVRINGKWGYINKSGKLIIKPIFDHVNQVSKERVCAIKEDKENSIKQYYVYNKKGKLLFLSPYETDAIFKKGIAKCKGSWYHGYINRKGEIVIPAIYTNVGDFENGFAFVDKSNDHKYIIDDKGKVVVNLGYKYFSKFSDKLFVCRRDTAVALMNNKGKFINENVYSYIDILRNNYAYFIKNNKYGIMDKNGNEIIPNCYDYISNFNGKFFLYKIGNEYGLIDKRGKIILKTICQNEFINNYYFNSKRPYLSPFEDGMAEAQLCNNIYFINDKGRLLFNSYKHFESFSEGYALINIGDKLIFVNKLGEIVIEIVKYE